MVQYGRFVKRALQGDLGTSYFFKEPTLDVILKKLPATLELVFAASILIITISIPLGVFCAIKPRHWFSRLTMAVSVIGISIPVFLTALGTDISFSRLRCGWMPSFGRGEIVQVWGSWSTNFPQLGWFRAHRHAGGGPVIDHVTVIYSPGASGNARSIKLGIR